MIENHCFFPLPVVQEVPQGDLLPVPPRLLLQPPLPLQLLAHLVFECFCSWFYVNVIGRVTDHTRAVRREQKKRSSAPPPTQRTHQPGDKGVKIWPAQLAEELRADGLHELEHAVGEILWFFKLDLWVGWWVDPSSSLFLVGVG